MYTAVQKNTAISLDAESTFVNTDYFANVCHEIRTPVSAIVGLSSILSRPDICMQKQAECVAMLRTSSAMLLELVNDLLDSFKTNHRSMELEPIAFDLTKVVEEAKSIVTVKAEEKGLMIYVQLGANIREPYIGDPLRIRQILINLLGNAIKFTHQGIIFIYMNEVRTATGSTEVSITVSDCGIGMNTEIQEKIFDKFTQGDTNISQQYGGSGLGLFISQELAHLMNGNITVKSHPNMGSQFILTLPLQKAANLSVIT